VYGLEQERRGVYAGAVGRFDFANDAMDTCIAIRTAVFKDGVAYLQAGGGIVHDSVEEDEYNETINKLKGNMKALEDAERELFTIFGLLVAERPRLGYLYDMQQATTIGLRE
jgi:anthranilate synthase component 1